MTNRISKIFLGLGVSVLMFGGLVALLPTNASAAPTPTPTPTPAASTTTCSQRFLTFPTWFRGLVDETDPDCKIKSPDDVGGLSNFIWHIVLNVIEIGLQLVVYLTIFFIVWGGFQFLTSQGVPEATAKARKTILDAVIGLFISIAAIAVVNIIFGIIK